MAGFLYFFAQCTNLGPEQIRAAELEYALGGVPLTKCIVSGPGGPNRQTGTVVGHEGHVSPVGYYPDKQQWMQLPGRSDAAPEVWVGRYHDRPIGPDDLAHDKLLPGYEIKLGDGNLWQIPVARGVAEVEQPDGATAPVGYCALPCVRALNPQSNRWEQGAVLARYRGLWQIALQAWERVFEASQRAAPADSDEEPETARVEVEFQDMTNAAVAALAANYRVGPAEISLLELFNDECVPEVVLALIDWPVINDWWKKKQRDESPAEADGSNASPGAGDDCPDTGPGP